MDKKLVIAVAAFLAFTTTGLAAVDNLEPLDFSGKSNATTEQKQDASGYGSTLDTTTRYYPNATLSSAVSKYKKANYAGCLQELFSYVQKKPGDAVAYYYMGMAFTKIGDKEAAITSYERAIALAKDPALKKYATLGKANLTGDSDSSSETTAKTEEKKELTDQEKAEALDDFINSPYGNGLSPELEKQMKEEKLKRLQDTINKKDQLERKDIEKIRKFDNENSTYVEGNEKLASASPSDKEILNAIKTLKDAGMNVSVQAVPTSSKTSEQAVVNQPSAYPEVNPYAMMTTGYSDPQMAQMSMMLGNNNNNNNNMMNMMPFLFQSQQEGKNIDPQVMQAIMMQQMMPSMDFGIGNNK